MSVLPMQTQCVGYIHSCADDDTTLSLFHSEDNLDDVVVTPLVLFVMCTRYECYQCVTTLSCVSTAQSDACDTMHTQCIGNTHIVCRGDTTLCVVFLWRQ